MRILHISDIHFGSAFGQKKAAKEGTKHVAKRFDHNMSAGLLNGIEKLSPKPDFIVITGDFVYGLDKEKDYAEVHKFLSALLARKDAIFNNGRKITKATERILIVPGNHDIVRGQNDSFSDFKHHFSAYLTPFSESKGKDSVEWNSPLYVFEENKLLIYCLSTSDICSVEDPEIKSAIDIIETNIGTSPESDNVIKNLKKRLFPDSPGIIEENIQIFRRRNDTFLEYCSNNDIDSNSFTKVILCHHPLISIVDNELKAMKETVNGALFLDIAKKAYGYDLVLHGHTHETSYFIHKDAESGHELHHIGVQSASIAGSENGIGVIDLPIDKKSDNKIKVTYKKYDQITASYNNDIKSIAGLLSSSHGFSSNTSFANNYGPLVDFEIEEIVMKGEIIKNGSLDSIQPASYDCSLDKFYEKNGTTTEFSPSSDSTPASIILKPGETIFVRSKEFFLLPNNMLFHAHLMSSWNKKGLIAKISGHVDPGFSGRFYFPVTNESDVDLILSADEKIMSIELISIGKACRTGWSQRQGKPREDF